MMNVLSGIQRAFMFGYPVDPSATSITQGQAVILNSSGQLALPSAQGQYPVFFAFGDTAEPATAGSGNLGVLMGPAIIETDQFDKSQAYTAGTAVYADTTGLITVIASPTAAQIPVGYVIQNNSDTLVIKLS